MDAKTEAIANAHDNGVWTLSFSARSTAANVEEPGGHHTSALTQDWMYFYISKLEGRSTWVNLPLPDEHYMYFSEPKFAWNGHE